MERSALRLRRGSMSELKYEIEYERLAAVVNYFTAKWLEGFAKRRRLQLVLKRLQNKKKDQTA